MFLAERIKKLREKLNSLLGERFYIPLFLIVLVYVFAFPYYRIGLTNAFIFPVITFFLSILFFFIQSKIRFYSPFIGIAAFLMLFSFFFQPFSAGVDFSPLYYLSFSIFIGSLIYSAYNEDYRVFWIGLIIFFASSMIPLTLSIPIGDEANHIDNLAKLETDAFKPEDFGAYNYVNVSFVYFYYLVIVAKIIGGSVVDIFFASKLFFTFICFLSFVLLATQFSNKRIGVLAALIAFFPILNLHLAPQMIGKYAVLSIFLYIYLKYFKLYRTRILLILLILLLVYVNITTLYISFLVFAIFVWAFFLFRVIKRNHYLLDLVTLAMFVILVLTYFQSINFISMVSYTLPEGVAFIPGQESVIPNSPIEEPFKQRVEERLPTPTERDIPEALEEAEPRRHLFSPILEIIPSQRVRDFFFSYTENYGWQKFYLKFYYYSLAVLLFLVLFIKRGLKNRDLLLYFSAVYLIVIGLIIARFQDGVHATLQTIDIAVAACLMLLFIRKPVFLLIILFGMIVFHAGADMYQRNFFQESSFEFNQYAYAGSILGYSPEIIPQTKYNVGLYAGRNYLLTCEEGKPREVYFDDKMVRCDDLARIGSIGEKVYENSKLKTYSISADALIALR